MSGDTVVSSYGGWVSVSASSWSGKGVHRLVQTACDRPDAWNRTPLAATPGAGAAVIACRTVIKIATMSGHNRWSKIKHKKEATDSKKSKLWTKVIKELTISARLGGGDINGNPRLRAAVDKARAVNMPNDTIDRAIKKGTGDLEGITYEEFHYEVFGPGGTAVLVEIMTDNRNRTASEIRSVITHHGGNLGASGSVGWMFKKQGLVVFEKAAVDEEKLTDQAIELGAEDIRTEGESLIVVTEPKEFERIREGAEGARGCRRRCTPR